MQPSSSASTIKWSLAQASIRDVMLELSLSRGGCLPGRNLARPLEWVQKPALQTHGTQRKFCVLKTFMCIKEGNSTRTTQAALFFLYVLCEIQRDS